MAAGNLTVLSQSSIQAYADCPRRFKLAYLDHLSYPAPESEPALEREQNQREGEYFHRLVQQCLLGMDPGRLGQLANSGNLTRWWNNFMDHGPQLDGCTTYSEYTLIAPLGSIRLVAKYDLIALRDGHAMLYDWKTNRRRTPNEQLAARWQTRVYMAVFLQSGGCLSGAQSLLPENIQMTYWFADFPDESAVFTYSQAQFQRDWDALCTLATEIPSAGDYPQTDDEKKCGYCVYRSYCDRGSRAAEGFPDDGELANDGSFDVNFEQIGELAF